MCARCFINCDCDNSSYKEESSQQGQSIVNTLLNQSISKMKVSFRDKEMESRCLKNTKEVLELALNESDQSTNANLARKALIYRKLMK